MKNTLVKNTLKKIPILGYVLKIIWRSIGLPLQAIYLRSVPEKEKMVTYFTRGFYYPSRSMIGRFVSGGGEWDGLVFRQSLPQILPQDAVVVEVGSNIGASAIVISEILKSSKFLLIDAADRYIPYLRKNTVYLKSANRLIGIETRAVSDGKQSEVIFNTNSTTGTPSNVDYKEDITSSQVVKTATLFDICEEHLVQRIDLLKVDTDGYEVEVFSGAVKVIERHAPVIFTEFSPPSLCRLHDAQTFLDILKGLGCDFFLVFKHSGEFLGVAECLEKIMKLKAKDYYVDLICAPRHSRYVTSLQNLSISLQKA